MCCYLRPVKRAARVRKGQLVSKFIGLYLVFDVFLDPMPIQSTGNSKRLLWTEAVGGRPKGMHRKTFDRLKEERNYYAGFAWAGLMAEARVLDGVGW